MPESLTDTLALFAGGTPAERHQAFQVLLAAKQHHEAAKREEFEQGVRALLSTAAGGEPIDRLLAVATMGKVAAVVKRLRPLVQEGVSTALTEPLPELRSLRDPDDRVYVAEVLSWAVSPWVADYASSSAIHEESAEEARVALVEATFRASGNIAGGLGYLAASLEKWRPDTIAPQKSAARRLRRVLEAVCKVVASDAHREVGDRPGQQLAGLVRAAFAGIGLPSDPDVAGEAAGAVASAVHELVRLSFSLATQSETYEALALARSWFTDARWETLASGSPAVSLVGRDIREALLILARQGIADDGLASQLQVAAGSQRRARSAMAALGRLPGVPDDLRVWLVEGRRSAAGKPGVGESETATLHLTELLADVLVDGQRFRATEAALRNDVLPELGALEPRAARQVERALNFGLAVCDGVDQLARRRRLRLRGAPGDAEDYSPIEHELTDGGAAARRVRVVRPVVEASREDGTTFVARKGIAERLS